MTEPADLRLVVKRAIAASPERLFEAWVTPAQLLSWWGPRGVRCTEAAVDLRVGGRYRLGNQLPDGRIVFISGEFLHVERPTELVYTWAVEPATERLERVTVRFESRGAKTEVVVVHERIRDVATKVDHEVGWDGCLDGLAALLEAPPA